MTSRPEPFRANEVSEAMCSIEHPNTARDSEGTQTPAGKARLILLSIPSTARAGCPGALTIESFDEGDELEQLAFQAEWRSGSRVGRVAQVSAG
jgi:hypothetical protein